MSKGRLEAFSDGVIAVAITLLVLDIRPPSIASRHSLGHELLQLWPNYAAYATSFITIGIIWMNHHWMIRRLRDADHTILALNLLLLMSIGILPFATSLMALYLRQSSGEHIAAAVYSGAFLVMSICFLSLNRHILFSKTHLLGPQLTEQQRRSIIGRSFVGLIPYAAATALAFVSPYITLIICGVVAVYYALPFSSADTRARAG
jgi:uncharacterized membrane protein